MNALTISGVVPLLEGREVSLHEYILTMNLDIAPDVLTGKKAGDAVLEIPFENVPLSGQSISFVARVPIEPIIAAVKAGHVHIAAEVFTTPIKAPAQPIIVNVAPPNVTVENTIEMPSPARKIELDRDTAGRLTGARVRDELRAKRVK